MNGLRGTFLSMTYRDELERAHPFLSQFREMTMTREENDQQAHDTEAREREVEEALRFFWKEHSGYMNRSSPEGRKMISVLCSECGIPSTRITGE